MREVLITSASGFLPGEVAVGGVRWKNKELWSSPKQVPCPLHCGRERKVVTSWHPQNTNNYAVSGAVWGVLVFNCNM